MMYATFGKGVDAVRLLEQSLRDSADDQPSLFQCVEWIFNAHRGGHVVHDRAEDRATRPRIRGPVLEVRRPQRAAGQAVASYLDKEAKEAKAAP